MMPVAVIPKKSPRSLFAARRDVIPGTKCFDPKGSDHNAIFLGRISPSCEE